jgi:mono/diheme cytochrome c family protein
MRRTLFVLILLAAGLVAAGLWLTRPRSASPAEIAGLRGDPIRGEAVFHAGGCASCHAAENAKGDDKLVLSGGQRFPSPFGSFTAPNISPDPEHGIGGWGALDLLNAMRHGTSPDGRHYYPAFPYTSYTRATTQDVVDLHAFLMTLPPSDIPSLPHDIPFPFNIRASLGGWKLLFLRSGWVVQGDLTPLQERGRYLVEALGHCGECHTPRNLLGGLERAAWLSGAPTPDGRGKVPGVTPAALDWPETDIAYYLETGFTPEFDVAGGHMTAVVENTGRLAPEDRAAIAAYLKVLPAAR